MKVVLSFQLLYMASLTFVKCSVLVFYKRIFVSDGMQKLSTITLGFVLAWCIGHMFAMVFICHPVAFWWDISIPGGYCLDQLPIYVSLIITNIFSDIVIMCLPMFTIWELKMKTTEKLALTAAFALGIAYVLHLPFLLAHISYQTLTSTIKVRCYCYLAPGHRLRVGHCREPYWNRRTGRLPVYHGDSSRSSLHQHSPATTPLPSIYRPSVVFKARRVWPQLRPRTIWW